MASAAGIDVDGLGLDRRRHGQRAADMRAANWDGRMSLAGERVNLGNQFLSECLHGSLAARLPRGLGHIV